VRLLVVGAGGHAKVVIDTARTGGMTVAGVVGTPEDADEVLAFRSPRLPKASTSTASSLPSGTTTPVQSSSLSTETAVFRR